MMIRKILAGVAVVFMLMGTGITVSADESEMVSIKTATEEIWEDVWQGRGDNGIIFPEASYKRHILEEWINNNYGSDDYNWHDIGNLKYSYGDYYKRMVREWDFDDDKDGNWTIVTPEHSYRFELTGGKWSMIDENGATVDVFMPFSSLQEEVTEKVISIADDGEDSPRVIGEVASAERETAPVTEETDEKKGSGNAVTVALCGAAVIGTVAFIIYRKKK